MIFFGFFLEVYLLETIESAVPSKFRCLFTYGYNLYTRTNNPNPGNTTNVIIVIGISIQQLLLSAFGLHVGYKQASVGYCAYSMIDTKKDKSKKIVDNIRNLLILDTKE